MLSCHVHVITIYTCLNLITPHDAILKFNVLQIHSVFDCHDVDNINSG